MLGRLCPQWMVVPLVSQDQPRQAFPQKTPVWVALLFLRVATPVWLLLKGNQEENHQVGRSNPTRGSVVPQV